MATTRRGTKRSAASEENVFPMFNKKRARQGAPVNGKWDSVGDELLVFNPDNHRASEKVAGFDLDFTLIATKSGRTFPIDFNDWKLWHDCIPQKLKKAHEEGMKVVIFTNQKGIQTGKLTTTDFKKKVQNIIARFDFPVQVFVSLGPPAFRKPYVGMWVHMEQNYNDGIPVDRAASIYVGDAAGRQKTKLRKKDHSNGDRLFALNLGVNFKTPEQYFLNQKTDDEFSMPTFVPTKAVDADLKQFEPEVEFGNSEPEVLVFVGNPGSGKSTIARKICEKYGYGYVNRDTLKTWQACMAAAEGFLRDKQSVVIDNTNPDKASRSRYIELAQKHKVPCRCFVMSTSPDHSRHNALFRTLVNPGHEHIPGIAFNMFKSKFEEPDKSEGFTEIIKANFSAEFQDDQSRRIYSYYLLDS